MHTLEIHISAALQTDLSRAFQYLHTDSDRTSHRIKNNPGYRSAEECLHFRTASGIYLYLSRKSIYAFLYLIALHFGASF